MKLPNLLLIQDYDAISYIDEVFSIFDSEVSKGNLQFLGLPVTCPWHPPYDNKHGSFWHTISQKGDSDLEDDRLPDIRRCERIRWISHIIQNANDKSNIICWEKSVASKRGRAKHVHLYLPNERYLIVLRRKSTRFELVTTFVVQGENGHHRRLIEAKNNGDPR